jgi:hypothetical protein
MKYLLQIFLVYSFSNSYVYSNDFEISLDENKDAYLYSFDINSINKNEISINFISKKGIKIISAKSKTPNIEIVNNFTKREKLHRKSSFRLKCIKNRFTPKIKLLFTTSKNKKISLIIQIYNGIINMDKINKQTIKYKIGTYPKMLINASCLVGEYDVYKDGKKITFFSSGEYSLVFQLSLKPGKYFIRPLQNSLYKNIQG